MGIFVYEVKNNNKFRVIEEIWTPKRRTHTINPANYPTFGISMFMTYEQAKAQAKLFNKNTSFKKKTTCDKVIQAQLKTFLNEKSLPKPLIEAFEKELQKEYSGNEKRLHTIRQHWKASQEMLAELKIDHTEFYDNRFDVFKYYEHKCWSADYIKRITKITNKWGSFCARQTKTFFEPIPKIGIRFNAIAEKRASIAEIRKPATPLKWNDLKNLKSSFENQGFSQHWNWLFIGLFFGLRPSEIENLKKKNQPTKKEKFYKIGFDHTNKIDVLYVYQNKLKNLPESKRWKIIPVNEPEQKEALKLIESKDFKKPLNKILKPLFNFLEIEGIGAYSPRKGFTDLMLDRKYLLEDISTFLGHSSIEMTWRHYKDKFTYILPEKTEKVERHLNAVPGGE